MADYHAYIRSPEWQAVKQRYRASRLPQDCLRCGSSENIELHHRSYRRLGRERLSDIVPLCRDCHRRLHHARNDRRSVSLWGFAKRFVRKGTTRS